MVSSYFFKLVGTGTYHIELVSKIAFGASGQAEGAAELAGLRRIKTPKQMVKVADNFDIFVNKEVGKRMKYSGSDCMEVLQLPLPLFV